MKTEYPVERNCEFTSASGTKVIVSHWGDNAWRQVEYFFLNGGRQSYYATYNHKLVFESGCYDLCFVCIDRDTNKLCDIKIMLNTESTKQLLKNHHPETQLTRSL